MRSTARAGATFASLAERKSEEGPGRAEQLCSRRRHWLGKQYRSGPSGAAAEDALKHGNPSAAADYAARAVKNAPQDNKLWFLLGYTPSRLAGRYQTSVDAYQHGLQTALAIPTE